MLIRDYRPADFPLVEALWKETGIYTTERGDTAEIIIRCNQAGGKFWVLEESSTGLVAGTSWITWDKRRLYLHHFAIRPDLQGKGLGRSLALKSLEFAREKNATMKLEVHQSNHHAIKLYRSLGFKVFKDYDLYMILDPGTAFEAK
jgi:ribosomal-protein-alanine N-acetyltransferase